MSTQSAPSAFAITPNSSADLAQRVRAVYVGGAGNIEAVFTPGTPAVVFTAVPAGTVLPICPTRINAATTATLLVGMM
jgi:hypothetical protein